ncbi:type II secretion system F family protein [Marinivivus vitaminiproducens]|uniref:type II secretion system F family protein n=1 Tax=Marinivivus vitaminiproducens TaxID=3035935 RepID=UPI0027AA7BFE|nr:type II secretion system F family protein [Geminicoccaceae bacterium SCSIO 64248]
MTWMSLLPGGLDAPRWIAILAGLAAASALAAAWLALLPTGTVAVRARGLAKRRQSLRRDALSNRTSRRDRIQAQSFMRRAVTRLDLLRSSHAASVNRVLASAGLRGQEALVAYLFAKLALPVLGLAAAGCLHLGLTPFELSGLGGLALGLGLVLLAAYAPDLVLRNMAQRRATALVRSLPDGLDLMVICAEAGLSLDAALSRVAREIHAASPELADELALTAVELNFLPERRRALANLGERTGTAGLKAMVGTLIQTEKFGTPLAHALRVLAQEMRTERMMQAEEKAARLPAILTIPMVLFILPPLFIVLLGPAVLSSLDAMRGM